jgi:hypothetical protein
VGVDNTALHAQVSALHAQVAALRALVMQHAAVKEVSIR